MAAAPRVALLLAALALLVVSGSCAGGDGMLRNMKRRPVQPADTPVYSFGYAGINMDNKNVLARSCEVSCGRYGFIPIQGTTTAVLCSYASKATGGTVWGTWTPAGTGVPVAVLDECRASNNGVPIDNVSEGVDLYNCGCCGTMNRRGFKLACPTDIVNYIASTDTCPTTVTWNTAIGGGGDKICLRATTTAGAPAQFGTIVGGDCKIFDAAPAATWQRVCLRTNI